MSGFYHHLGEGAGGFLSSGWHGAVSFVPLMVLQDPCVVEGAGLVGLRRLLEG